MNWKTLGDLAQNCVIGELSKYGLGIAFPLSDNYPFDLIAIANKKLFKIQVRGSSCHEWDSVVFKIAKRSFYSGEKIVVEKEDIDVYALWDYVGNNLYIIEKDKLWGKSTISIRKTPSKNKQLKKVNLAADFIISENRVKEVFDFTPPVFSEYFSKNTSGKVRINKKSTRDIVYGGNPKQHDHICTVCGKKFTNGKKNSKFCSHICKGEACRKVIRPTYDQLKQDMQGLPMTHIGAKYGVSDNAVRKWLKYYKREKNLKISLESKQEV